MVATAALLRTVDLAAAAGAVGGQWLGRGSRGDGGGKMGFGKVGPVRWLLPEGGGGGGGKAGLVRLMGRFRDPIREKVDMESAWDSAAAAWTEGFPEHLVVMVNGIVGSANDWRYAAEQFVKKLPGRVIVHRSQCNYAMLTFDGVDLMGERLAEEVLSVVSEKPGLQKISFVAHSLGGLVARYAIGRLYSRDSFVKTCNVTWNPLTMDKHPEGRVAGLEPMNFITVATPHLGSRGHKQCSPECTPNSWKDREASFLTDNDDGSPPLLLRMVDDCDDLKFRSALRSFRRRVAYANTNFDHMVGWRTSSIRRQYELPDSHLLVSDEKYPHVVYVDRGDTTTINEEVSSRVRVQTIDLEEEMIRGLTQVAWERVDVSFKESAQRYIAHSTIQVKTYWMNSDGADVVSHIIDNFCI